MGLLKTHKKKMNGLWNRKQLKVLKGVFKNEKIYGAVLTFIELLLFYCFKKNNNCNNKYTIGYA